ncbi:hypothetical protein ACG3SL_04000 [Sphingomonas sp. CJ20]
MQQRLASEFAGAVFLEARADAVTPALVAQGKPVVIFGQRVLLDGVYVTGGQPLAIIGQEVTLADGAAIDSSGLRGHPHFLAGQRARDGQARGDAGANGSGAGRGGDGGDVVIVCDRLAGTLAVNGQGGPGGDGQRGGNGMDGNAGPNGRGRPRCERGGNGGAGGNAGSGGAGGGGGRGAAVLVQVRKGVAAERVQVRTTGGLGGVAGAHGSPGDGGPGGRGTPNWEHNDSHGPQTGGGPGH